MYVSNSLDTCFFFSPSWSKARVLPKTLCVKQWTNSSRWCLRVLIPRTLSQHPTFLVFSPFVTTSSHIHKSRLMRSPRVYDPTISLITPEVRFATDMRRDISNYTILAVVLRLRTRHGTPTRPASRNCVSLRPAPCFLGWLSRN